MTDRFAVRYFVPSGRRFRNTWRDHIVTADHDTGHTYAGGSRTWARSLCGIVGGVHTGNPDSWRPLGVVPNDAALCRSCRRIAMTRYGGDQ